MVALSSRALTLRYLLALGLIAVFSILSHLIVGRALAEDDGSASVVAMSMRQLSLSQRIADMAGEYAKGRAVAHAELHQSLVQFEAEYRLLSSDEGSHRFSAYGKPQARAIYRDGLGPRIEHFIALAHRIDHGTPGQPGFKDSLDDLRDLARNRLQDGMEAVAAVHVHASEVHVQRVQWLQRAILGVILLLLLIEALGIFRPMIRRIVEYAQQLHILATRDALTDLMNRREFMNRARSLAADPGRQPMHVVMLDVDHFKSINDRHGHAVSDIVLARLGEQIRRVLRTGDIAARMGGEEFALLLPQCPQEGAMALIERLRESLAAMPSPDEAPELRVTVSAGVAPMLRAGKAPMLEHALRAADRALYRAKREGRDRVIPASPISPENTLETT